ncbi:unnamed protein product [Peniophora sp. CBMAI 1063]|nr:unnamed protein product [Peniophora sp. CBMAI 1063]
MRPAGYDIMVDGLPVAVALVHRPSPHTYAALGAHRARYAEKRRVLREMETEERLDSTIDDIDAMYIDHRPSKRSRVSSMSTYDDDDKENAVAKGQWAATTAQHDAMYERLLDSARWTAKVRGGSQYTYTRASSPVSDRTSSPPPFDCGHLVAARWDAPMEDDYVDDASASDEDEDSSDEDHSYPYSYDREHEHDYQRANPTSVPPFIPLSPSPGAQAQAQSSPSNLIQPNQFSWAPIEDEAQRVADRLEMTHLAGRFAAEFGREIDQANAFWRGSS